MTAGLNDGHELSLRVTLARSRVATCEVYRVSLLSLRLHLAQSESVIEPWCEWRYGLRQ